MQVLFFLFIYVFALAYSILMLRKTPFEISFKRSNFAGALFLRDFFLMVGLAPIILSYFNPKDFHDLANTPKSSVFNISLQIWLSVIAFITIVALVLRVFSRRFRMESKYSYSLGLKPSRNCNFFIATTLFLCICIVSVSILLLDAQHAFIGDILNDGSLKELRLNNKNKSSMPSIFSSFLDFATIITTIVLGANIKKLNTPSLLLALILLSYFLTFSGEKAPIVNGVIVFFITLITFYPPRLNARTIVFGVLSFSIVSMLLIFVVSSQYGHLDLKSIGMVIFNRLAIGQIAGTYEQLNLKIQNIDYIWHAIPFAGYFIDYPVFQKDLMIISESVTDPTSTGVKSTFFIAEAYAFGGMFGSLLSPIWTGITYAISFLFFSYTISKTLTRDYIISMKMTAIFFASSFSLTGGFSEWLAFKLTILMMIFYLACYFFSLFIKQIFFTRNYKVLEEC